MWNDIVKKCLAWQAILYNPNEREQMACFRAGILGIKDVTHERILMSLASRPGLEAREDYLPYSSL